MQPSVKLANVRILIVDDDSILRNLIRNALIALGFSNIIVASDGEEGINQTIRHKPHIIFCDWLMEPMNGIDFTIALRNNNNPKIRTLPIIMLSGRAERDDIEKARDAGVTEYLAKPFSIQQICRRIQSVVDNPRGFVVTKVYKGPDRRRKKADALAERRKKNLKITG